MSIRDKICPTSLIDEILTAVKREEQICPTSLIDEILTAVKREEQITHQSLTLIFVAEDSSESSYQKCAQVLKSTKCMSNNFSDLSN